MIQLDQNQDILTPVSWPVLKITKIFIPLKTGSLLVLECRFHLVILVIPRYTTVVVGVVIIVFHVSLFHSKSTDIGYSLYFIEASAC